MSSSSTRDNFNGGACFLQYKKFRCFCKRVADVKISGTDLNPNKLYYTCRENNCEFWFWAHPTNYCAVENENGNCIEQAEIMSMVSELKETRKEIKEMKVILKFFKFISIVMTLLVFLSFFVVLSK
ncbi:hypothetical protein P8452_74709 [Trifolium repens]|nr:hypothetical protein P8452_74709 [Trifolium repens]